MAGTYKTEGRERLVRFLNGHPDRQFTVDELAEEMRRSLDDGTTRAEPATADAGRGKSTLYRHLSELCRDGTVRKYRSDTQSAYVYQYIGRGDCEHHFHLKCVVCGRLLHLDCMVSEELLAHIREDHGFSVDSGRSILYGVCNGCRKGGC